MREPEVQLKRIEIFFCTMVVMHFVHLINELHSDEINCTDMPRIVQQTSARSYLMFRKIFAPISKPFQSDIRERQIFNEFRRVARFCLRAEGKTVSIKDISHSRNKHTNACAPASPHIKRYKCEQNISGFVESFKVIRCLMCRQRFLSFA